jgi:RNA polymerase sigma-70 factor (ECF subfamily)
MPNFRYDPARGSFKSWLRVVTRSRINVYCRTEVAKEKRFRDPLPEDENQPEQLPDSAGDSLDHLWQEEWELNLMNTAFRHLRAKVSSQQLLIFRLATLNALPLIQVAKKLRVSLPQVYLARHRVGKLFKTEIERLRRESE